MSLRPDHLSVGRGRRRREQPRWSVERRNQNHNESTLRKLACSQHNLKGDNFKPLTCKQNNLKKGRSVRHGMRFFHVQTSKTVKRSSFGIWSVPQAATCRAQGGAEAQGKGTSATQKSQCQYNSPRFDPWRGWRLCGSFVPSDFLKFKLQNVDKALTLSIV